MKGQWIGIYSGSNQGLILVNVDEYSSYFEGVAYVNDKDGNLPSLAAWFRTPDKNKDFKFRTSFIAPVNPMTGITDTWENVRSHYSKDLAIPEYAEVIGTWSDSVLKMSWTTSIGTHGTCELPCSKAGLASELVPLPEVSNWASFKQYVSQLEGRRHLFRGQNKPWRLRTSFHRSSRADLNRFLNEDVQVLHKHLSARTRHVFNLEIPNENGAFFNLVQHHGYPTPLLDWTYSPYVAAFFAYRGISKQDAVTAKSTDKVRIHVFDQAHWRTDWTQMQNLLLAGPHLSISEFLAIENERMIPQQAASTVTNIDDIESYIRAKEERNGKTYIWTIDLPWSERQTVIQELSFMGITAGSLFPGLDGACEELKERNFEI
jgi:hypothetical protein